MLHLKAQEVETGITMNLEILRFLNSIEAAR